MNEDKFYTTKCRFFEANSIAEMEDLLNDFFQNKFIVSSPIWQPKDNNTVWTCMVYYKVPPVEIKKEIPTIYQAPKQPSPATDKQKQMLKRLNIPFDETITKGEAFQLIKEVKG